MKYRKLCIFTAFLATVGAVASAPSYAQYGSPQGQQGQGQYGGQQGQGQYGGPQYGPQGGHQGGPQYGPQGPYAQTAGRHPAYFRAMNSLRMMRALLDRTPPPGRGNDWRFDRDTTNDLQHAIDEINAAMQEIQQAAITDGRGWNDHNPIDQRTMPYDRFRQARDLGTDAWHDLDKSEDDSYAHGLKRRAMNHIESANHAVDHIVKRYKH